MLDSVVIPTIPDAVMKYVTGWKPNTDARQWMKGQTPLWVPFVPFDVLATKYPITPLMRQQMSDAIIADSVARFGTPASLNKLMTLTCAKANWPFTWPENSNQWRLAPQETTLAHVVWAIKNGNAEEGFALLAAQFLAYQLHGWWDPADKSNPLKWYDPKFEMTPSQWSELRNGGNAKQNYGSRGRHRMVRGCIDYAVHGLEALHYFGIYDGAAHDYLQAKLDWHVQNLLDKFPLIDDPAGDHFGTDTPFVSVYQTASLRHILSKACELSESDSFEDKCLTLIDDIDSLLIEYGPVSSSDPNAPLSDWWYDIPFKDGKPRKVVPGEPGAQINHGMTGVAAYVVPMLLFTNHPSSYDLYVAMKNDAIARKWPELHPAETAWAFGIADL